jgi:hypothetical protein
MLTYIFNTMFPIPAATLASTHHKGGQGHGPSLDLDTG